MPVLGWGVRGGEREIATITTANSRFPTQKGGGGGCGIESPCWYLFNDSQSVSLINGDVNSKDFPPFPYFSLPLFCFLPSYFVIAPSQRKGFEMRASLPYACAQQAHIRTSTHSESEKKCHRHFSGPCNNSSLFFARRGRKDNSITSLDRAVGGVMNTCCCRS